MAERCLNRRNATKEHSKLQVKISELRNKTRWLTHHLKIAKERIGEISGDDTLALSILQCMTPNSKNKTLNCVASTLGLSPIRKRLPETCNVQVCNDRLLTDEEIPVSDLGEKIIAFMPDNDNSFECQDNKKRKECIIAGTLLKFFPKSSWQRLWLSVRQATLLGTY